MENRQLLEKIYGKNIVNMLQKKYFEIVENPDFVVEGAGDYCGDRLVFRVRLIEKRIEIEYESYSCAIVEASMFLMFDMLKEKSVIEQRTVCENILSKIEEGDVSIFTDIFNIQEILYRRKDCLILPWKLMNKVIETAIKIEPEFRDQPQIVRGNSLDCEACVSANYINTSTVNKENNRNSNLNVLLSIIDTPDKDLNYIENKLRKQLKFAPRRLGKIVLLEKEKIGLKKLVENWDDDYVILIDGELSICMQSSITQPYARFLHISDFMEYLMWDMNSSLSAMYGSTSFMPFLKVLLSVSDKCA